MKENEHNIQTVNDKDIKKFIELYVLSVIFKLKFKCPREEELRREIQVLFGEGSVNEDSFIIERDRFIDLLKQDDIRADVIESVRELYKNSGRTVFEINSSDEGSSLNEKKLRQEIAFGEKICDICSTKEKAFAFLSGKSNFSDSCPSGFLEDWMSVMRTRVLMRARDQTLNSTGVIDSSFVDFGAYLIFKAANEFYGKTPFLDPAIAASIVDWVVDGAEKEVVVVLGGQLMTKFLAYAYCRVGNIFVYNKTKNNKDRLFLELCKSISVKIAEVSGHGKLIAEVDRIPANASIITQDPDLKKDLDSKTHFEDGEASRILVIADSDIDDWMGVDKGGRLSESDYEKVHALAKARTIIKVDSVLPSKKYYLFLYDARYDLPLCGYTDFTNNEDTEAKDLSGRSDTGYVRNLIFKKIISSPFIAEQYFSNEMQFLFLMDSQRAQEIWKAKGYRFPGLKREALFSSTPASSGALEKYVTIKRGQVLAKASEGGVGFEINPGDINDAGLIDNPKKFVTHLDAEKNEKYRIKKGDILIGVKGMVGVVAYIDKDVENWYAGQAVAILRKKETKGKVDDSFMSKLVTPEFIFLCLKSSFSQSILQNSLAGRSKSIDMEKLRGFLLSFPEYSPSVYERQCDELFRSWREFQKRKMILNRLDVYSPIYLDCVLNSKCSL